MRDKHYAMGLIETFCFINTVGKDWWHFEDDVLYSLKGDMIYIIHQVKTVFYMLCSYHRLLIAILNKITFRIRRTE